MMTKIPLWDGRTIECTNCNTIYGVMETHKCEPQARCQSCFTPATLYPALNTRICVKCLAIIAKSILDSGLADAIKSQARRDQAAKDAAIVADYVKEMKCEQDESLLKECVKEITDGQ